SAREPYSDAIIGFAVFDATHAAVGPSGIPVVAPEVAQAGGGILAIELPVDGFGPLDGMFGIRFDNCNGFRRSVREIRDLQAGAGTLEGAFSTDDRQIIRFARFADLRVLEYV